MNVVAVSPHDPQTVFAGCDIGGVYKSCDGGQSWRIVNQGLDQWGYQCVATLAVDPVRRDTLYLGVGTWYGGYEPGSQAPFGGVYKSTDGGQRWQLLTHEVKFGGHAHDEEPFRQWGKLIAIDPRRPDTVYAGSMWDGVFRSDDAGKTWRNLGLRGALVKAVVLNPKEPRVVLVGAAKGSGTPGGLFRSENSGQTWQKVLEAETRGIAVSPSDPRVAYAGCWDQGVYKSVDGGASWLPVNEGLIPGLGHRRFRPIAVARDNPDVAYVSSAETGGESGAGKAKLNLSFANVHKTTDGGKSWHAVPGSLRENVNPAGGLFPGPNFFAKGASDLEIDPRDSRRLYLCDWGTIWRSDDGAENWRFAGVGLETTGMQCAAVHPKRADVLYLGWGDHGFGYTLDGGQTVRATFGFGKLHFACDVNDITVDASSEPPTLYAATSRPGGVFRSPDGGQSWTRLTEGLAETPAQQSRGYWSVVTDPQDPRVVYAGGDAGVFRTADRGGCWHRVLGDGLPEDFCCKKLIIAPKNASNSHFDGHGGLVSDKGGVSQGRGPFGWVVRRDAPAL